MEKRELLRILEENGKMHGDIGPEAMHIACDDALLEFINDPEITAAFSKGVKWYS